MVLKSRSYSSPFRVIESDVVCSLYETPAQSRHLEAGAEHGHLTAVTPKTIRGPSVRGVASRLLHIIWYTIYVDI